MAKAVVCEVKTNSKGQQQCEYHIIVLTAASKADGSRDGTA